MNTNTLEEILIKVDSEIEKLSNLTKGPLNQQVQNILIELKEDKEEIEWLLENEENLN